MRSVNTSVTRPLEVVKDPRLPASIGDGDLARQNALAREVQDERVRIAQALRQAASLRKQIADDKDPERFAELSKAIDRAAGPPPSPSGEDWYDTAEAAPTSLRRLSSSFSSLQRAIESADMAPTPDMIQGLAARRELEAKGLADWSSVLELASARGLAPE